MRIQVCVYNSDGEWYIWYAFLLWRRGKVHFGSVKEFFFANFLIFFLLEGIACMNENFSMKNGTFEILRFET